jgi:hypothetical protein
MTAKALLKLTPIIGVLVISVSPAMARHQHQKDAPTANIFTPPAGATMSPTFNKGKTPPTVVKMLDGSEEPRWDIVKTLPDLSGDQSKALNKLQQETQKILNSFRTQMNDAQQELKELKANKGKQGAQSNNPAVALLNPDGKPYMGPLLGTEEMGMDPNEESQEDVQALIDGLKQKVKDYNQQAATQAKALLTPAQLSELDLMRQGQLVVTNPENFLVDSPAEPSTVKHKRDRELASNNAGARVLRSILSETARGIRQSERL